MRRPDRNLRSLRYRRTASGDSSTLAAGPVTVVLEGGALRWIRYRGIEVIRGIAFLVRDRTWNTASATIENLRIDREGEGFAVTFDARCRTADGDLSWRARITGAPDGTVRFEATASPAADFVTNRTGFVVLHPLDGVVGEPVVVTNVDGRERRDAVSVLRRSRAVLHRCAGHAPPRDRRRLGHLRDGGRRLGDRGSPQLARCVVQDLRSAAAAPLSLHPRSR